MRHALLQRIQPFDVRKHRVVNFKFADASPARDVRLRHFDSSIGEPDEDSIQHVAWHAKHQCAIVYYGCTHAAVSGYRLARQEPPRKLPTFASH